jgi:hypothetical protein
VLENQMQGAEKSCKNINGYPLNFAFIVRLAVYNENYIGNTPAKY